MYRIILVDDEEEVRKSMVKKMDWESAGFEVIADAENGEDALEKIELLEPDVVLTDIRMPYMDGLTLCNRIRQTYPNIKIVIFSGFDDFEYAKQAIGFNVSEYILKPVDVKEMTIILNKVCKSLNDEIEQKRNVTLLRESYQKNLPILRQHFLNTLIQGGMAKQEIEEYLEEYNIPIGKGNRWVSIIIDFELDDCENHRAFLHEEKKLIPMSVKQMVEDSLLKDCSYTLFEALDGLAAIIGMGETLELSGLMNRFEIISKNAKRVLFVDVTIGIGQEVDDLSQIYRSYKSAVNALGYKAIEGRGSAIYIKDVEPGSYGKLVFDGKDESDLISAIKFGSKKSVEEVLEGMIRRGQEAKVHSNQCRGYLFGLLNCMIQLTQQYNMDLDQILGKEYDSYLLLGNLNRWDEIRNWFFKVAVQMNVTLSQERDHANKNLIQKAQLYIQEHYPNPDLSVEFICNHLHISPAYFSTLFKKETGQAYTAYLTDLRLNKAMELLKKTDEKTYVIALKVGYLEQNYFSYVFKKKFGMSPTKYRGMKG